ncbi:conserved hypothetical protein [Paenibacillus curdlanolyticus YK9]|uniref:Uncharacterized protein n=1 Tax=Paenibacillus curdlanolyticus YK9 TaxID=717606 RepID=E0I4G4_9BACL|nr:DUF6547 family protein [Paenibacillus curdlanolyticus]EFM12495.1 conserved hypothetical protein [Paenibacillus curdlanolyticus YK9]
MNQEYEQASLDVYKSFIDDLVDIRPGVLTLWAESKGWPKTEENAKFNSFLSELTQEQRAILAMMIQQSRDGGIHDVLAYLSEETNLNGLKIMKNDVEMSVEPFGTQLYFDWVCRREGDDWPDSRHD